MVWSKTCYYNKKINYKKKRNLEDSRFAQVAAAAQDSSTNAEDSSTNGVQDSSTSAPDSSTAQQVADSIEIKYISADVVSEGIGKCVTITRSYSKYMPKWYVLSESVYDVTGNRRYTGIDSAFNRRRMNTRSDVMNYVKNSDSARIMKFESQHTYSISNVYGYIPSVSTPLYESVMFVKFDNDDNVVEKIYLGNNKIA